MKISQTVNLEIKDQKFELTLNEAKELRDLLNSLLLPNTINSNIHLRTINFKEG